ncbi:MAG: hypothetical protein BGN88_03195 [Clostridiales bacterium 43-6]|nr:MAG: hypothetical protein BGN88_03195 [Clostridiales bacterium 43-6]
MAKTTKDLTQGSVSRQLIQFALPFLISSFIQSVYGLADMIIVGRFYGSIGISAVQIATQITIFITNLVVGFSVGGTVLIAQNFGAKRMEDVKETIGSILSVFIIAAILITGVMLFLDRTILELLHTPKESFDDALQFLNISMAGTIFIFGYNAISSILRALGDSVRPMYFVGFACIINVILDIVFLGVFHMRAGGAALATVISQAVSLILSVIYLYRMNFIFDFKLSSFRLYRDKVKLLFSIGLPSTLQQSVVTFSFIVLTAIANETAGIVGSNALGIGAKVNSFAILPGLAMSAAVAAMSGQNIGAGNIERAKKTVRTSMVITFSISLVCVLLIQIFAHAIIGVFLPSGVNNKELIDISVTYLRIMCFDSIIVSGVFSLGGLFNGSGHTMFTLFNSIVSSIGVRISMAYLLTGVFHMGMTGMGLAIVLAPLGSFLISLIYYKSGRWQKPKIIKT